MCAAYVIAIEWRIALPLACLFAWLSAPVARRMSRWHEIETSRVKSLIEDVARQRSRHPDEAIVLRGVDDRLFWSVLHDRPFQALGIGNVWLAPGTRIEAHPGSGDLSGYLLPAGYGGPLREYLIESYRLREATTSP